MKREESMNSQWRDFLAVFTVAAAAVTPAFGQAVAPNNGKESAASIPDFSGIWVHSIPGFEPLPSGPTALVNRSLRTERKETTKRAIPTGHVKRELDSGTLHTYARSSAGGSTWILIWGNDVCRPNSGELPFFLDVFERNGHSTYHRLSAR
jgi:hypothetical protein